MLFERDGQFARAEMLRSRHYNEWGWSSHINSLAEKHGSFYRTMQRGELEAAKATLLDVKREADTITGMARRRKFRRRNQYCAARNGRPSFNLSKTG